MAANLNFAEQTATPRGGPALSSIDQDKKTPARRLGWSSLFAVTHQGPAQGGKAGGSELPGVNLTNSGHYFKRPDEINR
jgi:hypothetical protein